MSIFYDKSRGLLTLETDTSTYQMRIENHRYLEHLYYGPKVGDSDMSFMHRRYDRGFSGNPYAAKFERAFSLDTLCQEYSSRCAEFRYVSHEIKSGKYALPGLPAAYDNGGEAETLIVTLRDRVTQLTLRLYYGVFPRLDVITRAAEIVNEGSGDMVLEKAASVCLDIPSGSWDLLSFHGRHCMERQPERAALSHAVRVVSSERGMSSHQQNPFVILCDREANEDHGDCYGLMLAYSGSFKAEIERDQFDSTRVVMGISDTQFRWKLASGERFFTPEAILAFGDGLTRLSHIYHAFLRNNICRGKYKLAHRPVLLNNWEATYYAIGEDRILALAEQAAALGAELERLTAEWKKAMEDR